MSPHTIAELANIFAATVVGISVIFCITAVVVIVLRLDSIRGG